MNWWKYTEEDLETASYSDLVTPIAPEVLKTTSWRTYRETGDTIVCFQYTENPIIWENAEGEMTSIRTIGFVLPEKNWSEDNTKGFFLISKSDEIGINEGIYTYYYPPELANHFWDFVDTAKLNEVTYVPGKTMTLNDVILLSEKKEDLLLGHFKGYAYEEKGDPLLFVRTYPINDKWQLMIHHGGGLSKPIAIWLMHSESGRYVDVTKGNEDGTISDFIKTHDPDSVERVFTWYDTYSMDTEDLRFWQQHISLPGAVGVTVQEDTRRNIQILVSPGGSYETVISGRMIRNVFFTDLTGDGISEICATVATDSNLVIQVYDYALDNLYMLEDSDNLCVLSNVADRLLELYKRDGWTRAYGQLSLYEGKLIVTDIDKDLIPLTQTVSCVDISNRKLICLSDDGDIKKMLTILKDLESQVEPAQEDMLATARTDMFYTNVIEINYVLGTKVFCFSEDFRFVWEFGEENGYRISDPSSLRNFVESVTDGVRDKEVAGEPFADVDSPWNWCANINQSAVKSAEVHVCLYTYGSGNMSGSSSSSGTISLEMLRSLTDLLNQIPKDNFIRDGMTSKESYHDLYINQQAPNASISIIDGVNNLGVIINLRNEKMTMVMTDEIEKVELDNFTYLEPTQVWEIQDPALLEFMKSVSENPPVILYSVGAEYSWQAPLEYSQGNFQLTVRIPEGWEYIQNDTGIRCRPESEDEGWICFGYYPERFSPMEENRYLSEGSNEGYPMIISYPSSVKSKWGLDTRNAVWSYTKIQLDQGDYVICNDGADAWFLEYEDQINDMMTLATFSTDE